MALRLDVQGEGAERYLPYAKQKLRELKARMKRTRTRVLDQVVDVGSAARIYLQANEGIDRIRIRGQAVQGRPVLFDAANMKPVVTRRYRWITDISLRDVEGETPNIEAVRTAALGTRLSFRTGAPPTDDPYRLLGYGDESFGLLDYASKMAIAEALYESGQGELLVTAIAHNAISYYHDQRWFTGSFIQEASDTRVLSQFQTGGIYLHYVFRDEHGKLAVAYRFTWQTYAEDLHPDAFYGNIDHSDDLDYLIEGFGYRPQNSGETTHIYDRVYKYEGHEFIYFTTTLEDLLNATEELVGEVEAPEAPGTITIPITYGTRSMTVTVVDGEPQLPVDDGVLALEEGSYEYSLGVARLRITRSTVTKRIDLYGTTYSYSGRYLHGTQHDLRPLLEPTFDPNQVRLRQQYEDGYMTLVREWEDTQGFDRKCYTRDRSRFLYQFAPSKSPLYGFLASRLVYDESGGDTFVSSRLASVDFFSIGYEGGAFVRKDPRSYYAGSSGTYSGYRTTGKGDGEEVSNAAGHSFQPLAIDADHLVDDLGLIVSYPGGNPGRELRARLGVASLEYPPLAGKGPLLNLHRKTGFMVSGPEAGPSGTASSNRYRVFYQGTEILQYFDRFNTSFWRIGYLSTKPTDYAYNINAEYDETFTTCHSTLEPMQAAYTQNDFSGTYTLSQGLGGGVLDALLEYPKATPLGHSYYDDNDHTYGVIYWPDARGDEDGICVIRFPREYGTLRTLLGRAYATNDSVAIADALAAVRAARTVLVNNFASPELIDLFGLFGQRGTLVVVPRRPNETANEAA